MKNAAWALCLFFLIHNSYGALPSFHSNTNETNQQHPNSALVAIPLHYRKASNIVSLLKKSNSSLIGANTSLIADDHSNQLWAYHMQNRLDSVKQLIHDMDKPEKQISIAVKMMAIDTNALHSLGLHLNDSSSQSSKESSQTIVNVKQFRWWLDHLDASIEHGSGEMIASPTLLVSNHNTASIESGQELPYQERTREGDTNTNFKNATLHLDVRPDLLPKQAVMLNIHLQQDKVSELNIAGMPAIQTEKINTAVRAKNHHTVVLGGVYTHRLVRQIKSVAILGSIPLLGRLFQHTYWLWQRQELMIFVTPSWS